MKFKIEHIIIAVLVLLMGVAIFFGIQTKSQLNSTKANYIALADTLETSRDELGRQTATIQNIEALNKTAFLGLKHKDATIQRLQDNVAEYKGKLQAAIATTSITASIGSGTTVSRTDTIYTDTGMVVQEVYFREWVGPWEDGWIEATPDSIFHSISIKDSIDITIGSPRNWNPFKKQLPEITLESANPNVTITNLRSVTFKGWHRRIGLTFYGGYGLTADFSGQVHHGFQLGVGAGWRIYP